MERGRPGRNPPRNVIHRNRVIFIERHTMSNIIFLTIGIMLGLFIGKDNK